MTDNISKVVREMRSRAVNLPDIIGDAMRDWADRLESATTPEEADGAAMKARENLRQVVEASVAKSGSGAVLVSACTVADLFADYATLARQLAEAKAENERLQKAMKVQANAVETLRSADRAIAAHDRAAAERLNASCKPEMVDSEKAANAMLTDALEQAESALAAANAEIERLKGVVECKTIDANERGNALTVSAETKRDLKAQLAEATRRLGEVEKAARQWKQDAREMGRDSDPRGIWNETLVNCADRIHAALTKEPAK